MFKINLARPITFHYVCGQKASFSLSFLKYALDEVSFARNARAADKSITVIRGLAEISCKLAYATHEAARHLPQNKYSLGHVV